MVTAALFVGDKKMAQSKCLSVGSEWMSSGAALQWRITPANKCNSPVCVCYMDGSLSLTYCVKKESCRTRMVRLNLYVNKKPHIFLCLYLYVFFYTSLSLYITTFSSIATYLYLSLYIVLCT